MGWQSRVRGADGRALDVYTGRPSHPSVGEPFAYLDPGSNRIEVTSIHEAWSEAPRWPQGHAVVVGWPGDVDQVAPIAERASASARAVRRTYHARQAVRHIEELLQDQETLIELRSSLQAAQEIATRGLAALESDAQMVVRAAIAATRTGDEPT